VGPHGVRPSLVAWAGAWLGLSLTLRDSVSLLDKKQVAWGGHSCAVEGSRRWTPGLPHLELGVPLGQGLCWSLICLS
jgi:hypothetical protein